MIRIASLIGLLLLSVGALAAADGSAGDAASKSAVELHDAWMRETPAGQPAGAYVTIENKGDKPDTLMFVTGPDANHVDINRTEPAQNGATKMTPLDKLEIPAKATLVLEPGQTYLTVFGLQEPLSRGRTFFLVLHFEHAGDVAAHFVIRAADATGPLPHDDTHGSDATRGA